MPARRCDGVCCAQRSTAGPGATAWVAWLGGKPASGSSKAPHQPGTFVPARPCIAASSAAMLWPGAKVWPAPLGQSLKKHVGCRPVLRFAVASVRGAACHARCARPEFLKTIVRPFQLAWPTGAPARSCRVWQPNATLWAAMPPPPRGRRRPECARCWHSRGAPDLGLSPVLWQIARRAR